MKDQPRTFQLASTAPQLMTRAREATGIFDIVDRDISEVLEKYVHALNTEAGLNEAGATAMEWHLLQILTNRLRMLRDFRQHPEIEEQQIIRPLIISGAARTGSTKLQKMLAASGDFLFLPCWQGVSLSLLTGDRSEDAAERIRIASEHIGWFNDHAPNARLIHEFSTFEPEEENLILAHLLFAPYMLAFALTPEFLQWYVATQDFRENFRFLKRGLQYLQWQFHDGESRPWVLKNPTYLGLEPLLAEVFPDAAFVCTHREPVSTMSSSLSLLHNYHVGYSDIDHRLLLGQMMVEGLAIGREQQIAVRNAHPDLKVLDIPYSSTTANAETVLEQLYAYAGLQMSDQARQAMRSWEQENSQHKLGAHLHRLEDFGVNDDAVRTRFGVYIGRFGNSF